MFNLKIFSVVFTLFGISTANSNYGPELGDPMINPGLFEGDIAGIDENGKVFTFSAYRWENGIVPYVIDGGYHANSILNIRNAMDHITKATNGCIKFKQQTIETNYIRIFRGKGCYSFVGMRSRGGQNVSLGKGCESLGTVVHELLHVLGFFHEQSRNDRDQYIRILTENILPDQVGQFKKIPWGINSRQTAFDFNSVMLYGSKSFSANGRYTMVKLDNTTFEGPRNKDGLSQCDIKRIIDAYNCPNIDSLNCN